MTTEEKAAFAAEAQKAVDHPITLSFATDYLLTHKPDLKASRGIAHLLTVVAQVARAQALGIDPEAFTLAEDDYRDGTRPIVTALMLDWE